MAAIDKTYLNWEDYCTLKEWCKDKSFLIGKRKYYVSNYLFQYEEEYEGIAPVWNTPIYLDIWLIRNCQLPFIVERLKEQYCDTYTEIAEYRSVYDTFNRNGLGKNIKYKVLKYPHIKWSTKRYWWIQCYDISWDYNEKDDMWYHFNEAMPIHSNTAFIKNFSLKKFHRKLKKWNLPSGLTFRVMGYYVGQEYLIKTV